jgi:DNA-binding response OmpR family regulator
MSQQHEQPGAKRILVVEDEEPIAAFLRDLIAQETPYQVTILTHPARALETVWEMQPHLFILNYHLPQTNGIDLYDQLHTTPGLEDIPAIMISARLPEKELQQRNIVGINKPFDLDEVLEAITRLIDESNPEEQRTRQLHHEDDRQHA